MAQIAATVSAGDIKFGSKYTLKLHIFVSIPDIETNFESKYIFLWSRNVMKYVSRKKEDIYRYNINILKMAAKQGKKAQITTSTDLKFESKYLFLGLRNVM